MNDMFLDCKNLREVKINRNSFNKIKKKLKSYVKVITI